MVLVWLPRNHTSIFHKSFWSFTMFLNFIWWSIPYVIPRHQYSRGIRAAASWWNPTMYVSWDCCVCLIRRLPVCNFWYRNIPRRKIPSHELAEQTQRRHRSRTARVIPGAVNSSCWSEKSNGWRHTISDVKRWVTRKIHHVKQKKNPKIFIHSIYGFDWSRIRTHFIQINDYFTQLWV